jgi:hypothetical protein
MKINKGNRLLVAGRDALLQGFGFLAQVREIGRPGQGTKHKRPPMMPGVRRAGLEDR